MIHKKIINNVLVAKSSWRRVSISHSLSESTKPVVKFKVAAFTEVRLIIGITDIKTKDKKNFLGVQTHMIKKS